ncbi:MAG: dehydrogenase [Prevotella sp.]|nr:dehydrogenase [Prevotella sp.]MBP5506610.1 dehydrogenase [Prevotella sp.]
MADNYLEKHREEYEARKAEWLRRKHRVPIRRKKLEKPEDEAL